MTGTFSSHYARTSHQNQNQQQQHSPGYVPAVYNHRSKYPGVVPFRTGSPSSPLPPDELSLPQLISVQHNNSNGNHHKSGLTKLHRHFSFYFLTFLLRFTCKWSCKQLVYVITRNKTQPS
jgi:hypothetical protein